MGSPTNPAHGPLIDSPTADSNSARVNGFGRTLRTPSWRATEIEEPVPSLNLAERSSIGLACTCLTDWMIFSAPRGVRDVDDDEVRLSSVANDLRQRQRGFHDNCIACLAQPALEQAKNQVVWFDDKYALLLLHDDHFRPPTSHECVTSARIFAR